jgi:hypothetical protein
MASLQLVAGAQEPAYFMVDAEGCDAQEAGSGDLIWKESAGNDCAGSKSLPGRSLPIV